MKWIVATSLILLLLLGQLHADDLPDTTEHSHLQRNFVIGNLVGGTASYFYFTDIWGKPTGKFHIKHDIHDNLALTDEVSHMFAAYQIAEGSRWLFGLLGMPQEKVETYSLLEAAMVTTFVEFPLDAFNPTQGFGVSDLVFDYAGVGFSYLRHHGVKQFDMKFSVKRSPFAFDNKFLAAKNQEFDNFIWWGTWKPRYIWLGFGYSTNHDSPDGLVNSEYYLGAGTTLYDLLDYVAPKIAKHVKVFDTFFINLHVEL